MVRQNVEALRRVYDEWAKGDFSRHEMFDPTIEGVWAAELPESIGRRGIVCVGRVFR